MLLQHATWQEVEKYLTQSTGIIIPIGSTEQHGPKGLIGTDAFDFRQRFPDGRMISNSNLANIEAGKMLFETAIADLAKDYQEFLVEK